MAAQITTPDPIAAAPPTGVWARPMIERDLAVLERLSDLVMEIAAAVGRQVARDEAAAIAAPQAPAPPAEPCASEPAPTFAPIFTGDIPLAITRRARAVRTTCALRARLIRELDDLDQAHGQRAAERLAKARTERKAQLTGILFRLIDEDLAAEGAARPSEAEGPDDLDSDDLESDQDDIDRLFDEAAERLDDRDRIGDLLDRPASEIIDQICRDLGLSPDWRRLAEEAWAKAEIASGKIGTPLTSLSSPANGGGGPRSGGGGASPESAPSVTARPRRATFPADGEGEAATTPEPEPPAPPDPRPEPTLPPRHPPNPLSPDWGWTPRRE